MAAILLDLITYRVSVTLATTDFTVVGVGKIANTNVLGQRHGALREIKAS